MRRASPGFARRRPARHPQPDRRPRGARGLGSGPRRGQPPDRAVVRYSGRDVGVAVIGIDPKVEARVNSPWRRTSSWAGSRAGRRGQQHRHRRRAGREARRRARQHHRRRVRQRPGARVPHRRPVPHRRDHPRRGRGLCAAQERPDSRRARERHQRNPARLDDPAAAREVAARAEAALGYKAVSWQEANEALMSVIVIRNVIMYTVVAAILLVAGFGIFNIISTITHEKARDIAILKSLGFRERDMRRLFLIEGLAIGMVGSLLGWLVGLGLCSALASLTFEISWPDRRTERPATRLEPVALPDCHGFRALRRRGRRLPAGSPRGAAQSRRHHSGRDVSALIEARAADAHPARRGAGDAGPGRQPDGRGTRVRRPDRALGVRQVVAPLPARPARPPDQRRAEHPRPRHRGHGRGRAIGAAADRHRLRLPVSLPVAGVHRARERRDPDAQTWAAVAPRHARPRRRAAREPRAWSAISTSTPTSSRAASASAWRWRGRSPTTRRSCWPTSRPGASTRRAQSRSLPSCRRWYASAARRSSP